MAGAATSTTGSWMSWSAWPGSDRHDHRVRAHPDPGGAGRSLRRAFPGGLGAAPAQAAIAGQVLSLRMWDRAGAAAEDGALPGEVLRGGDAVHHLRHRDHLPVPLGGGLPVTGTVRPPGDDGVHR